MFVSITLDTCITSYLLYITNDCSKLMKQVTIFGLIFIYGNVVPFLVSAISFGVVCDLSFFFVEIFTIEHSYI